jgi:homoserine O-succinyltransferase/O-acetyltransferase
MKTLRIGILDMYNGATNEGMRCIKMLLDEFYKKNDLAKDYQVFDVRGGQKMPALNDFDAFISTGGPGSPILENTKWENNYFKFIEDLVIYNEQEYPKKYLFAICHSFQLLYQYFKLGQITKRHSTSFGVLPINTVSGLSELILAGLNQQFWAVDSRDYQAILPIKNNFAKTGAQIVCLEKERPHVPFERAIMAIRFTSEIFGTQFHPEADAEGMHRLFKTEDKKAAVIKNFGEEKYYDMIDKLDDEDKIILTESIVLPNFLKMAFESVEYEVLN